jgi:hypothetical protein
MSKERELLERIYSGEMSFGPQDNTPRALKQFQFDAENLMETLDWLRTNDYIGNYQPQRESTSAGNIDRVLITAGLTLKGQNKSKWPD